MVSMNAAIGEMVSNHIALANGRSQLDVANEFQAAATAHLATVLEMIENDDPGIAAFLDDRSADEVGGI